MPPGIKEYVQRFIPGIDSPDKVYELFRGLGYPEDKVLDPTYKRKISEFGDKGYGKDLQGFLLRYCHIKAIYDNEAKRSFEHANSLEDES